MREKSLKMVFIKAEILPPNSYTILFSFQKKRLLISGASKYARIFFFSVLAAESQLTGRCKYYMQRVDYLVVENLEEQISGII